MHNAGYFKDWEHCETNACTLYSVYYCIVTLFLVDGGTVNGESLLVYEKTTKGRLSGLSLHQIPTSPN